MNNPPARPPKAFLRLWLGQAVSVSGSGMTSFALGVHTYQQTGSATFFALITLFATLPGILISPLAGVVVDRFNRRTIMILSDTGSALATLALALLFWSDHLALWHIYLLVGINSFCGGFQLPAAQAAITQLVPKAFYGRASGMIQMSRGMQFIVSPVLAGSLMGIIGLPGILMVDLATFLFGISLLLGIHIPSLDQAQSASGSSGWGTQIWDGVRYLAGRPGMVVLIGVIAVGNLMIGFLVVLVAPMILAFTTEKVLGIMNSLSALGMMVGSVLVSVKGLPKSLIPSLFLFMMIGGLGLAAMGFWTHPLPITVACFLFFFAMPFVNACQETIWRRKIEFDMQGRVFALTRMIVASASTLAFIIAGPLADQVFEPLLMPGGKLVDSVGVWIGVGPGRGIALMLVLSGGVILLTSILGYLFPGVRSLESDYPDVARPGEEAFGTA